ncbi:hypothetical protein COU05_02170 [bacterium (Candidatus Gribaldobacteria) CG10_big_fil_rev_8_21_14_0_10_37_21]|uniref:DUF8128 domain-containing protein n=2 Tax=Candidatus Gribaldobacteria TaxID=2798536 RepID=A0A2H0UU89_9BACT|nr:MAG: hypothetical protein AUJ25_03565 [Parcubacteria group bacterium CG1_02_37_13]PIR90426.1 MAG: hypothetical protein COU05_02170 [bacterium (Candidatus Gribaldobacteria) CG10_big_fil_rev_8_21_14_0_10_37_21]
MAIPPVPTLPPQVAEAVDFLWAFLSTWWWVPLPFLLASLLKDFYLWWRYNVYWGKIDWVLLELRTPRDVERPMKAMEQVIANFWTLYDPPDFKEIWFEGKFLVPFELEIAGIDGNVHFFIRTPSSMRKVFESAVYSQYPDVEIVEVEDYTKQVPQDLPNENWDMWGCDFKLVKPECYPLKTYVDFFEPTTSEKEEKRIDPLAVLIEGMTRLKKGEQLWFQIRLKPVQDKDSHWIARGKKEIEKITGRKPKEAPNKSITGEAIWAFMEGRPPSFEVTKEEEKAWPVEMRLTPGERDILSAIENKIGKLGFESNVRMIYLGENEAFFKPNLKLILNFSVGMSTSNLNNIMPTRTTKVVAPAPFRKRKLYMKKKRMFRRYIRRQTPLYPWSGEPGKTTFALNTEEVATMFHFPSKAGAPTPTFERIEAKKAGPPLALPVEE